MCGIVGYVGPKEAGPLLVDGLRKLEYRGYDSAGIALLSERGLQILRCRGKLDLLDALVRKEDPKGQIGIGHTRWATHGRPSDENAHPHSYGGVAVVHNGIIENHLELRAALKARGHHFNSETDTEIFAHLIAEANGSNLLEAVRNTLSQVKGTYALGVLSERHPGQLVVAKNASPLVLGLGHGEQFVASDVPALLAHTREVVFLDEGEIALLQADHVEIFDAAGRPVKRAPRHVDWTPLMAEKAGHKHFMHKEIHEQPTAVANTLRGRISLEQSDVAVDGPLFERQKALALTKATLLGCGTSYHAALLGKMYLETLAKLPTEVDLASEFRNRDPIVPPGSLAVAVSQSGETLDTLGAIRESKSKGAHLLAICNVIDSAIARESDTVLYTHAGPEIGVASTKCFSTQLAALFLLAVKLGRARGVLEASEARLHLSEMLRVPQLIEETLRREPQVMEVARRYHQAKDFLYLGRGPEFPVALEGALKLKEISYIHAEGYAAGEMKHGPIALIDENLPVVVIATPGPGYEKMAGNIEEVRARGGRVIGVCVQDDLRIPELCDEVLTVPSAPPMLLPLLTVLPLQLLAYHIADQLGTDVDQPRNLAKSVTVE